MLILDNEKIRRQVLQNHAILEKFPFLYPIKTTVDASGGCSTCQRAAKETAALEAMATVKKIFANLPGAEMQILKQLLNTDHIRIYWSEGPPGQEVRMRKDF